MNTKTIKSSDRKARNMNLIGRQCSRDSRKIIEYVNLGKVCWQLKFCFCAIARADQYRPCTGQSGGAQISQGVTDDRYAGEWDTIIATKLKEQAWFWLAARATVVRAVRTNDNVIDLTPRGRDKVV